MKLTYDKIGEYRNEISKDSIITKNIVSVSYSLKHNMQTGVASLRNDILSSIQGTFCHLLFIDIALTTALPPTKQAGGHTDYLLYISTIKKLLFKTYNGYGKDLKEFICHRNR